MNKTELQDKLRQANVDPTAYPLDGGLPNEAYCLNESSGRWEVYYSERGSTTGLKTFDNEDDACDYLYSLF